MEDNGKNKENLNKDDNNIPTTNKLTNTSESDSSVDNKENDIEIFIEKISVNLSILYKLYISGKILYYLSTEGHIIYFIIEICKDTDINPFDGNFII